MEHSHIKYELRSFESNYMQEALVERIIELAVYASGVSRLTPGGMSVLDVGCGRGELLKAFREKGFRALYGLDIDGKCVELSGEFAKCTQGDASDIRRIYKGAKFDIVITSHMLEHCENPKKTLLALGELSRRWVIVAVPNAQATRAIGASMVKKVYSRESHIQVWDFSHFHNFLAIHGKMNIKIVAGDLIRVVPTYRIRRLIGKRLAEKVMRPIERKMLPRGFPCFCDSLIALCETSRTVACSDKLDDLDGQLRVSEP